MERRLVLFGYTGSGKSSTGNMILGKKAFKVSSSGSSVSFKTEHATTDIDGRPVEVVDTPGIFDTSRGNDETLREITRCFSLSAPGPHALILVVQAGRVTKSIQESADLLMKVFGDRAQSYMILLFTCRDDLEFDGDSTDDFVKSLPDGMKRVLEKCGNRYLAFNNRAVAEDVKQAQVRELKEMVDTMVATNKGQIYTSDTYAKIEKNIAEWEKKVKENLDKAALRQRVREEILNDKGEPGGILNGVIDHVDGMEFGGAGEWFFTPVFRWFRRLLP